MNTLEPQKPKWRVREWRTFLGWTIDDLAEKSGVHRGSISEIENGKKDLRDDLVAKLTFAFGIEARDLLLPPQEVTSLRDDIVASQKPSKVPEHLKIVGEVAAGSWIEPETYEFDPEDYQIPADPRFNGAKQFLLRIKGTSVNRKAPSGSLVRCLDVYGAPRPPQHNDWVVARRKRANGDVETTVKKLIVDRDGSQQLWPDSDDPAHQTPVKIRDPELNTDEDAVAVIAFVLDFIMPGTRL